MASDKEESWVALGARIRALREEHEWSQAELGERLGSAGGTVHRWEAGKHRPQLKSLRTMARLFGMDLVALVGSQELVAELGLKDEKPQVAPDMRSVVRVWLTDMQRSAMEVRHEVSTLNQLATDLYGRVDRMYDRMEILAASLAPWLEEGMETVETTVLQEMYEELKKRTAARYQAQYRVARELKRRREAPEDASEEETG